VRLSSLSWSKTSRFPAKFAKEPDQHSSTISLWIAHYRPTSVMKAACHKTRTAQVSHAVPFLVIASRLSSGFLPPKSGTGRHS
jgi:hypothetical protein